MTITVAKGHVTDGHWSIDWSSTGTIENQGRSAKIKSLTGHAEGKVGEPASGPKLSGDASIDGAIEARASGLNLDVPIKESASAQAQLTVEQATCEQVGGTFVPSFTTAARGEAYFSGTAHWSGKSA
jgi:hypothetical protein